jgi:hypothetical protein
MAGDVERARVCESFLKGTAQIKGTPVPGRPHQVHCDGARCPLPRRRPAQPQGWLGAQVEAVLQLLSAVRQDQQQQQAVNYLLQHSTGSGKSLTIACLVCHLVGLVDCAGRAFHTVLVVNDRLQLDRQLGDTVEGFLAGGHAACCVGAAALEQAGLPGLCAWALECRLPRRSLRLQGPDAVRAAHQPRALSCPLAAGAGNGLPPDAVRRAGSTAELAGLLEAAPGSKGRPAVIFTTIQKLGHLWKRQKAARKAGGAARVEQEDAPLQELARLQRQVGCAWQSGSRSCSAPACCAPARCPPSARPCCCWTPCWTPCCCLAGPRQMTRAAPVAAACLTQQGHNRGCCSQPAGRLCPSARRLPRHHRRRSSRRLPEAGSLSSRMRPTARTGTAAASRCTGCWAQQRGAASPST